MELINYHKNKNETGIYCIKNKINNKIYIGSTKKSFSYRKNKHLRLLRKKIHYNEHLQNSWNYYKEENFKFEVLFICPPNECDKYEGNFIKLYSSNNSKFGYNIACVSSYKFNYKISDLHNNEKKYRKKEKAANLNGLYCNEKGLPKPFKIYDLNGNLIKEYNSAKEFCEIHKLNIRGLLSETLNKRKLIYKKNIILFSNEKLTIDDIKRANNKINKKVVDLFYLNGEFIQSFKSAKECANFIGCKDAEVRMCCLGKRSRIKNYITKYVKYE